MTKKYLPFLLKFTSVRFLIGMSLQSMAMEHHVPNKITIDIIRDAHRIAFYTGAFDPLHNGHHEVMEAALGELNLDLILVSPDPDENNYKPYMSNRHTRLMMLKRQYGSHPNITPCFMTPEILDEIVQFSPTAQIFGIVGSDNILIKLSKQRPFHHPLGHSKVSGYLVHVREGDNIDLLKASDFFKKKVIPLTIIKYPNLSSTKIRNQILAARDTNTSIKEINLPIPQSIQDFITEINPYKNIPNPPNKFTLLDVKEVMSQTLKCDLKAITPFQRGLSGDLIYLIDKIEEKFIAKILIGTNRDKDLHDTWKTSLTLENLSLQSAKFVNPIRSTHNDNFNVIIFPFMSGKTVLDYLLNEPLSLDKAEKIGQALAELNTKKSTPCSEQGKEAITGYYKKLMTFINTMKDGSIKDPFPELSLESLQLEIKDLYDDFMGDPGFMGYNHGDASPTNLIITAEENLYFIDYAACSKTIDQDETPIGFPTHDLSQFISGIFYHLNISCKDHNFDKDSIVHFSKAIRTSYIKHAKLFITPASLNFFEVYYYAKSLTTNQG